MAPQLREAIEKRFFRDYSALSLTSEMPESKQSLQAVTFHCGEGESGRAKNTLEQVQGHTCLTELAYVSLLSTIRYQIITKRRLLA